MTKMNPWWDTFQGQYSHVSDIPFLVAWKWTVILQNHLRARPRSEPARNNLNRRIHLWRLCEKRLESSWTTIPHNMFILEHFVSRRPLQFNLVSPSGTQCDFPEDANIIIIKKSFGHVICLNISKQNYVPLSSYFPSARYTEQWALFSGSVKSYQYTLIATKRCYW